MPLAKNERLVIVSVTGTRGGHASTLTVGEVCHDGKTRVGYGVIDRLIEKAGIQPGERYRRH